MTSIQEKYGKESVAFISTGQMSTEDMALLGHVGRNYMEAHQIQSFVYEQLLM